MEAIKSIFISLLIFSTAIITLCFGQKSECNICGTYFAERKDSKECVKIEPNGTFMHYWSCEDITPANIGIWEMQEIAGQITIILSIPKKENEEQVYKDFYEGKINKDDYYTSNSKDLKMEFESKEAKLKYVKWNERIYIEKQQ